MLKTNTSVRRGPRPEPRYTSNTILERFPLEFQKQCSTDARPLLPHPRFSHLHLDAPDPPKARSHQQRLSSRYEENLSLRTERRTGLKMVTIQSQARTTTKTKSQTHTNKHKTNPEGAAQMPEQEDPERASSQGTRTTMHRTAAGRGRPEESFHSYRRTERTTRRVGGATRKCCGGSPPGASGLV